MFPQPNRVNYSILHFIPQRQNKEGGLMRLLKSRVLKFEVKTTAIVEEALFWYSKRIKEISEQHVICIIQIQATKATTQRGRPQANSYVTK